MPDFDLAFVDSIVDTPTTRLDLMAAPWSVQASTEFGLPELNRAVVRTLLRDGESYPAAAYGNRLIRLVVQVHGVDEDKTASALQALYRELDRPTNVLKYRPGTTNAVHFKTFRCGPDSVLFDPILKQVTALIPAEPFALGTKTLMIPDDVIIANDDMESGIAPWTGQNGTVAQSSTYAHGGTYSLELTPTGGVSPSAARSEQVSVAVGTAYTTTMWMYSAAGYASGAQAALDWYTSGGSFLSSSLGVSAALPAGVWTEYTVTASAPAGAGLAQIRARMSGTPTSGDVIYVDDATLTRSSIVLNDPAAGGMYLDVTGVQGDVETPLLMQVDNALLGGRVSAIATRRRGDPALAPLVLQAEAMTLGTGASLPGNDAAMSGSGSNYARVSFGTASMIERLTISRYPATDETDTRGRYRVWMRYRKSVAADEIGVRLVWAGLDGVTNDTIALPTTHAGPALADLGTISWPFGADPVFDGASGVELAVRGFELILQAERTGGSGTLDIDYLLFIPADDSVGYAQWSDESGHEWQTVDAVTETFYPARSGPVVDRPSDARYTGGGWPYLSPGVTNRIYFLRNARNVHDGVSFADDQITQSTEVSGYYWPRYLTVKPPVVVS